MISKKEKKRLYDIEYRKNNKEKRRTWSLSWYHNNKEKCRIMQRRWKKRNPWLDSYYNAKYRCSNAKRPERKGYSLKGIKMMMTVKDFKFLWFRDRAYLMKRPSIDRVDNDGNYEVSNCRFIEQSENTIRGLKVRWSKKEVSKVGREFKCRVCGLKKPEHYCCESDIGICLDCCEDDCSDSIEERRKEKDE